MIGEEMTSKKCIEEIQEYEEIKRECQEDRYKFSDPDFKEGDDEEYCVEDSELHKIERRNKK